MKCYICSKETEKFSDRYSDKICLECDARFLESDVKSKQFRDEYKSNHRYCPKCGSEGHMTTLVGYVLNMDDKENYKNLNNCQCSNCGDKHTAHERVK